MAYKTTSVSVSKSQEAIRDLLIKYGSRGVQFSEDFDEHEINVRFAKTVNGEMRTVSVSLKVPNPQKPKRKSDGRWYRGVWHPAKTEGDWAQMTRATYRALHWWLKSQFEFVEFGGLEFEDIFLSHFEFMLEGHKTTIGSFIKPRISSMNLLADPNTKEEYVDGDFSDRT